jgi:hypothetical protein
MLRGRTCGRTSVTDGPVPVNVQWVAIDQPAEAVGRRQGRREPFDPVLDVLGGQTGKRSQVNADDPEVVPLVRVTDDAVPAAMSRLVPGAHDRRADPGVAGAGAKRQMVKVPLGGLGRAHGTARRARAIV